MADAPAQRAALELDDIQSAAWALEGVAVRTPLLPLGELSTRLGHPLRLKAEFLQPIGAFKIRGAWTAITRLDERARTQGVITHSSGNHGQAVAWVGARLGTRTVIVMPEDSPQVKIAGVRRHGAEIVFCKRTERVQVTRAIAERDGLVTIPPYEHEDVIAGQATCALEILEEWPDVAEILVPVGGGGLLAGTMAAVRALSPLDAPPSTRVIGVEPAGAAKLGAALAARTPITIDTPNSIADGLLPASIGCIPWGVIKDAGIAAVQVDDAAIAQAVRYLRDVGLRVEPSGAVALAALLGGRWTPAGPVAVIASGGNVDDAVYDRLVAG
jgi:threonine dehydratase